MTVSVRFWFTMMLVAVGCATTAPNRLGEVRSWALQLDGLERAGAVDALAAAPVDMLVIEPTRTVRGYETFPVRSVVSRLRRGRLCLAYINVGQAEDYRTYWPPFWKAPTADGPGSPDYLLALDPEGWPGNYPVSFWDIRWRAILWGSSTALIDQALAAGFDGVYLDWILGFEFAPVVAAAEAAGIDPARAMADLVRDLRTYARKRHPQFLVVIQNPGDLAVRVPELYGWIDGVAQEDISFRGRGGVEWEDETAGDIPIPEQSWEHLAAYRERNLPVFTVDYARRPENIAAAKARSRAFGFVPYVSLTPLDRLFPPSE